MKRTRLARLLAGVAIASLALGGTAGASERSSGGESSAARQYVADSAPVNSVSDRFQAVATSWIGDSSLTNAQAESAAKPLIAALGALEHRLGTQRWPSGVQHDVTVLTSSFVGLSNDLRALAHDDLAQVSTWEGPLLHDDLVTTAATNEVRHDLGLPALTSP